MDDTSRCGGPPASCRAMLRISPAPRSRRPSTTDNSGTTAEAAARYLSGTHERRARGCGASSRPADAAAHAHTLLAERREIRFVRRRQRANDDVDVRQRRKHVNPYDFAKPAFHEVSGDRRMRILRHDDAGPGVTQKGSDVSNLEIRGSASLPLKANRVERAFPRQPIGPRKAAAVRLLRTSTEV